MAPKFIFEEMMRYILLGALLFVHTSHAIADEKLNECTKNLIQTADLQFEITRLSLVHKLNQSMIYTLLDRSKLLAYEGEMAKALNNVSEYNNYKSLINQHINDSKQLNSNNDLIKSQVTELLIKVDTLDKSFVGCDQIIRDNNYEYNSFNVCSDKDLEHSFTCNTLNVKINKD